MLHMYILCIYRYVFIYIYMYFEPWLMNTGPFIRQCRSFIHTRRRQMADVINR